jgi:hypothetical protein
MMLCDDCERCVDDESGVVVDVAGVVPTDSNCGNDERKLLMGKLLGG